jgi:iron(III) transport system substrate-binding protein
VVIDDAVALVRGAKHPEAAKEYIEFVGSIEGQLLTARKVYRLPARLTPADSVPQWVADVEREMKVAPMDWEMLASKGGDWMTYWDQHVRGSGDGSRERGSEASVSHPRRVSKRFGETIARTASRSS